MLLLFGGSLPSARMSSSLDSTDATACCRKFHLDAGFEAIAGTVELVGFLIQILDSASSITC